MTVQDIVSCLGAEPLVINDEAIYMRDYRYCFATDLMSDALAMIQTSPESTVLVTGLANIQTLNTAEMLDINMIVLVRGKTLNDMILDEARDRNINIVATKHTMYSACGRLYANGLSGINE